MTKKKIEGDEVLSDNKKTPGGWMGGWGHGQRLTEESAEDEDLDIILDSDSGDGESLS